MQQILEISWSEYIYYYSINHTYHFSTHARHFHWFSQYFSSTIFNLIRWTIIYIPSFVSVTNLNSLIFFNRGLLTFNAFTEMSFGNDYIGQWWGWHDSFDLWSSWRFHIEIYIVSMSASKTWLKTGIDVGDCSTRFIHCNQDVIIWINTHLI